MLGKKLFFIMLFFLLFLILAGGAVWYFFWGEPTTEVTSPLQASVTPRLTGTPSGAIVRDTEEIKAVIGKFYLAYGECLRTPPAAARGNVSVYCQSNTGVTTEQFPQNLREKGSIGSGIDPVTCAQNPPSSVSAETVDYEEPGRAVATAVALFGGGFAQKIPVLLLKENAAWRVDSVTCPRP